MARLSADQIAAYAVTEWGQNGVEQVAVATAVALAESGGQADQRTPEPDGSTSYGLWQVNSVHGYPVDQLLTPEGNVRAAGSVYSGAYNAYLADHPGDTKGAIIAGWQPWSAYKNGAYLAHLPAARRAAKANPPEGDAEAPESFDPVGDAVDSISSWTDAVARFFGALVDPRTWLRVLAGIVGVGMVVVGARQLAAVK